MEMRQIPPLACFGSRWVSVAEWPFVAFLVLAREHGDAKPPHAHGLSRRSQNRGELATVAIRSDGKDVYGTRSVASVASVAVVALPYRMGTTFRSLATFIALAERLPVDAFRMYSLHQAIIGRRRSM